MSKCFSSGKKMRLSTLLNSLIHDPLPLNPEVQGLCLNSQKLEPGEIFIALKGTQHDGRQFLNEALKKHPAAILIDDSSEGIKVCNGIPVITIQNLRSKLGALAACFYDYPAKNLQLIGVTGTSGKTSCTHYLADCLASANVSCGLIGTLGSGFIGSLDHVGLTTPDAITLHAKLKEFLQRGAKAIAMEVSSHSIDQGRINNINYDVAIFTNLSQDHLDYHGDMQTYAQVKFNYLASKETEKIILNIDDEYAKKWLPQLSEIKKVYTYSVLNPAATYVKNPRFTEHGIFAHLISPWGEGELKLPLIGAFNLSNALAVITALGALGFSTDDCLHYLSQIKPVPGRMQMLGGNSKPLVVVDYAHKPDALDKVLQALRLHTKGKLFCVFGCGGERDRGKRPIMAKIAEAKADAVIVTNDNPRHENPHTIVQEIMQGFRHKDRITIELDRSKAIQKSIQWASVNDCILIAGKGAERYQQIGDDKLPFDDVEQVTNYLSQFD